MNRFTVPINVFKGSYYDFGVYQAEILNKTSFMNKLKKWPSRAINPRFDPNHPVYLELMNRFPFIIDEIKGLADGLNLSFQEAMSYFSGFSSDLRSGCSIVMKDTTFVRNYDQNPNFYDGQIILFQPSNSNYASMGPTMLITGRTDGINEHGLIVGYNFVTKQPQQEGLMCNIIARLTLDLCKNVDEAVELITSLPHKTPFNYCLMDKSGKSLVLEITPQEWSIRQDIVCTNHFIDLKKYNHKTNSHSLNRYATIKTHPLLDFSKNEIFDLFNNSNKSVFAHDYHLNDGTLHTTLYDAKNITMAIAYGADRTPVTISLNDWINDEPLRIKKIVGSINIDHNFMIT